VKKAAGGPTLGGPSPQFGWAFHITVCSRVARAASKRLCCIE
jgi:hypothetical protein